MNICLLPPEILTKIFNYIDHLDLKFQVQYTCKKFRLIYVTNIRVIESIRIYNFNNYIENVNYLNYVYVLLNSILNNKYIVDLKELIFYNCNFLNKEYLFNFLSNDICFNVRHLSLSELYFIDSEFLKLLSNHYSNLEILKLELCGVPQNKMNYICASKYLINENKWWIDENENYMIKLIISLSKIKMLFIPNRFDFKLKRDIDFYREQFKLAPISIL